MHIARPDIPHTHPPVTDAGLPLPANPRILLVEHDPAAAQAMTQALERSGMTTTLARSGARAMTLAATLAPALAFDIVLMDLDLPDTNGAALLTWFTRHAPPCGIPPFGIIIVSGHGEEADRIMGLELGADDYIVKPPQMRELVARIRAVHRRVQRRTATARVRELAIGPIRIHRPTRAVIDAEGRRLPLTAAEFTLLDTLALAQGHPVSRDALSEAALRRPWRPEDRSVDQLVSSLRHKLPPDETGAPLIHSVRGAGYLLRAPD